MNLKKRSHQKEQLDNLELSGNILHKTLRSLKWINTLFGNHRQLGRAVLQHAQKNTENRPITIVDLGCGGGDSLMDISKKLQKNTIQANYIGIDGNAESVAHAQVNNSNAGNITYVTGDILHDDFELPPCDLVICSHFIYHFNDEILVAFLKKIVAKDVNTLIFSELYRSKLAFNLFKISHIILPISKMAKRDGLLAIQRAFTIQEMKAILEKSSLENYNVEKKPWFRMLVEVTIS